MGIVLIISDQLSLNLKFGITLWTLMLKDRE